MNRKSFWLLVLGLAWGVVFTLPGQMEAAPQYWFEDLGTLPGGKTSWANAINDNGQVTGFADNATGGLHAFRWTPGNPPEWEDLGALSGNYSEGKAINNNGEVVGYATLSSSEDNLKRAIFCAPGDPPLDLGTTLGGLQAWAWGINDAGQIVGYSERKPLPGVDYYEACWWQAGQVGAQYLPTGDKSYAWAVNQSGQAAGNFLSAACRWDIGTNTYELLGSLGGLKSDANAINDLGQVVGWSYRKNDVPSEIHAFLWTPGVGMEDLTPDRGRSNALAINNAGQVLVQITGGGYFLWTRTRGLQSLNDLVDLPPEVTSFALSGMNNLGQIVGRANPSWRACLLTPIPEPPQPKATAAVSLLLLLLMD